MLNRVRSNSHYDNLYAGTPKEYSEELKPISGKIPAELAGVLYRNGPACWQKGDFYAQHLFDGDGMISSFRFEQGRVQFRNRYIQTPKYRAENRGNTMRGLGSQRPGGMLNNAFRMQGDRANTHALLHAGKLLALSDDGRPWELDQTSLETRGTTNFYGRLSSFSLFSPHPKLDPNTGEMFNFGLAPHPKAMVGLRCYRVDQSGLMKTIANVPLNHFYINHDFAITDRYLVFVLAPIVVKPLKAMASLLGLTTFENASQYQHHIGTRIILVPRDGGKVRVMDCPPLVYVHFNNAYDDGDQVMADLIQHDDWDSVAAGVRDFRLGHIPAGRLTRLHIDSNDTVEMETLCDLHGEFPQHDWRRTGSQHNFSYYPVMEHRALIKLDHRTGHIQRHPFADFDLAGEPIFVPASQSAAEDEGWLLSLVYRTAEHQTELVVLNAQDLEADPVAVVPLPEAMFPGFHGSFSTAP